MVCRENKARSALMGYDKHLLRQLGYENYSDHEIQSLLHETRHMYGAMGPTNVTEYVAFLKGMRQGIINDPTLTDAQKFRKSGGRGSQPGYVTRIDEELQRVRTGTALDKDGNPKPLTADQMNTGRDFAAMQRLMPMAAKVQEAKQAYLEMWARHTGRTVAEARRRWDEIVQKPKSERLNTEISLTDGYRDKLLISGFTAEDQATIGQSNRTRETMRLMEVERLSIVETQPKRKAIRPEHHIPVLNANDPRAKVKCEPGGCGQFGHEVADCPNAAEVAAARQANTELEAAMNTYRENERYAHAANHIAMIDADEPVGEEGPDGNRWVVDPVSGEQQQVTDELIAQWREDAPKFSKRKFKAAQTARNKAIDASEKADAALEQARGPIPYVSEWVQALAYNPDNGTLLVQTKGYTRKTDGEYVPPKTYPRRVSAEEIDSVLNGEDSLGASIQASVFARASQGGSERFKAPNEAAEQAMLTEQKCLTCGQWASLTSDHRCPVTGSADEREEHRRMNRRRENLELAARAKLPAPVADNVPRHRATSQKGLRMPDRSVFSVPDPREIDAINKTGGVAIGRFEGNYLGSQVNGEIMVWTDKRTGQRAFRIARASCSCGEKECRHMDMAANGLGRPYKAVRTYGSGGAPLITDTAGPAANTVDNDPDTLSYEQIQQIRQDSAEQEIVRFDEGGKDRIYPRPATRNGLPVDDRQIPDQWSDGAGTNVDVTDPRSVAAAVKQGLDQRTGQDARNSKWAVTVDPEGGVWVRSRNMRPLTARGKGGMTLGDQYELGEAFATAGRTGARGVYIPSQTAWRHQMLDQLFGTDSGIKGMTFNQPANGE